MILNNFSLSADKGFNAAGKERKTTISKTSNYGDHNFYVFQSVRRDFFIEGILRFIGKQIVLLIL